ncbi:MAG TPA: NYN domain-containing protein [Gammaproteobacteria bacterium]|nr:NYN domain-containing protein [Gammaproteobacteria bacterium]
MKKVSIFVDVQNIYYTTKSVYQRNFDYNKFWTEVTHNRQVVTARAYATARGDKKQEEFQSILRAIGFDVKLKPFIQRRDGSSKGDWDVGITIDVIEYAQQSDIVVLASGDGDFDLLIKEIKTKFNTETEIYGVPSLTAYSLIAEATDFKPITEKLLLG